MTQRSGPNVVTDPNERRGPYRILLRTDGKYVLVHDALSPDGSVSAIKRSLKEAITEAENLVALEAKCKAAGERFVVPIANPSRPRLEVVRDEDDLPQRRRG